MTMPPWIICERSTRWAAALRTALSRYDTQSAGAAAIQEVRSVTELSDRLKQHPNGIVLIEVTPKNLELSLAWIAETTRLEKQMEAVALLDIRRPEDTTRPLCSKEGRDNQSSSSDDIAAALREAGASDVIGSPRQIRVILALGERHALNRNLAPPRSPAANQSFENWAWSLLPWQAMDRPVG